MTNEMQTKAQTLRPHGITLVALANEAGRSVGYVKQWSCGARQSKHLDKVASRLKKLRPVLKKGVTK